MKSRLLLAMIGTFAVIVGAQKQEGKNKSALSCYIYIYISYHILYFFLYCLNRVHQFGLWVT